MKRFLDCLLALFLLPFFTVAFLIISPIIKLSSPGPAIFWSYRIGKDNKIFRMPKFRTMYINTPIIPTDQINDPYNHITPFGRFLRKSSLDEFPQILSVLFGNMSFIGPRPLLPSQSYLIKLRTKNKVNKLRPGISGWAQVNGRDNLNDDEKFFFDLEYFNKKSFIFDLTIILLTLKKIFTREGLRH